MSDILFNLISYKSDLWGFKSEARINKNNFSCFGLRYICEKRHQTAFSSNEVTFKSSTHHTPPWPHRFYSWPRPSVPVYCGLLSSPPPSRGDASSSSLRLTAMKYGKKRQITRKPLCPSSIKNKRAFNLPVTWLRRLSVHCGSFSGCCVFVSQQEWPYI